MTENRAVSQNYILELRLITACSVHFLPLPCCILSDVSLTLPLEPFQCRSPLCCPRSPSYSTFTFLVEAIYVLKTPHFCLCLQFLVLFSIFMVLEKHFTHHFMYGLIRMIHNIMLLFMYLSLALVCVWGNDGLRNKN